MSQTVHRDTALAPEHQDLIEGWFAYHRSLERSGDLTGQTNAGDSYLWAIERLDQFVTSEPEVSWPLILEIFVRTESDYQRACLAAGLLEDLLNRHGLEFIDRIEAVAAKDAGFRDLLTGVWRNVISEDVWRRIQHATSSHAKDE